MRTALLSGRDHTLLGGVAAVAERDVAIALSRGGAPKTYQYREANEDACAFAWTPHACLVAVADGHWGAGGSALALEHLLERHAERWTAAEDVAAGWRDQAPELLSDLNRALLRRAGRAERVGRTTLSLCLVRRAEGRLLGLSVGDSHLFRVEGDAAHELGPQPADDPTVFLGDARLDRAQLAAGARICVEPLPRDGAVVLATDGLSEPGIGVEQPAASVAESAAAARAAAPPLRPLTAARGLALAALAAQRRQRAGDNVATACVWLGD